MVISCCLHSARAQPHHPSLPSTHLLPTPSSRWNEQNPAVCIPTASHNVSNPHLFAFLLCLLYTYDTRPAPLITRLFVSSPNLEPPRPSCFYVCMPIIIEKGKLGERSCVTLPVSIRPGAQCQTKRRHGSHLEPKDRKSFTPVLLLKPRSGLAGGQEICLPYSWY